MPLQPRGWSAKKIVLSSQYNPQLTTARMMESLRLIASGSRNRRTMSVISMAIATIAMKMIHPDAPRISSARLPDPPRSLSVPTATAAPMNAANEKTWDE